MEIHGDDSSEELLTGKRVNGKKGGRPREIDDEELLPRLREMEFVLDQSWGTIGWALSAANKLRDIQDAFLAITIFNYSWLDAYRERETEPTSVKSLRSLRKSWDDACTQVRRSISDENDTREAVQRARSALQSTSDLVEQGRIRTIKADISKRHNVAMGELDACRKRSEQLQSAIWRQEAYFAQSQLLAQTQSARFRLSPLNLAMSMAGMPVLSARISHERCHALVRRICPGLEYQKFQALASVLASRSRSAIETVDQLRLYLCAPERAKSAAIVQLKEDWHFLRAAIASKWDEPGHTPQALPFRIFADYQRRVGVMSQADVLLAAEAKL